jgi:ComF family protein
MKGILHFLTDFVNLLYPRVCPCCGQNLFKQENLICTKCLYFIPKTNFHHFKDNPVARLFWGRVNIENAMAYYFFDKGSKFQALIHNMKYRGQKEIGYEMGRIFGNELKVSNVFSKIDLVIPVPLHARKQRIRGYNQSEWIARGIAERMEKPLDTKTLFRAVESETQTSKTRYERWKNVENIFKLKIADALKNKHILLVDDVVTTGSTLEACARVLLTIENTKVSIATLAMA